jgi:hypothetical protein
MGHVKIYHILIGSSNDLFHIKLNCIVFGVDIALNKKCILSLEEENIVFPNFKINSDNINDIEKTIITNLKEYVFVSDLELIPQLINIHSKNLSKDTNTVEVVYGFIINHTLNINNCYWIDFNPIKENPLSPVLFEVMQKLT